jgi:hydroxymethylbilane synthase
VSVSEEFQKTVIGTRGSDLALVQAAAVERTLSLAFPDLRFSRNVIRTTGDRRTDVALADVAKAEGTDKGIFTKELEEALRAGEIDLAVHSLKDVPTVIDDAFEIAGVLQRAPVRDVLVSREPGGLEALPAGAVVGTSSVRRAHQLKWLRPDLKVVDLRGNVPTRLKKLAEGACDAIMLAEAGLVRLGYRMSQPSLIEALRPNLKVIEPRQKVPSRLKDLVDCAYDGLSAADAGLVRLGNRMSRPSLVFGAALYFAPLEEHVFFPEIRKGDEAAAALVAAIRHEPTFTRVRAEREFLRLLEGGCSTPVGVYTSLEGDLLKMDARVFPDGGGEPRTASASGSDPLQVARQLFDSLA